MSVVRRARVQAPAKINLSLRIVGRRPDGYHLLDSVMTPIDLCDELTIEVSERERVISVSCSAAGIPEGGDNLAYRAADLFLNETGMRARIEIRLDKHIPPASGLGGGSSDAAAVLVALNRLRAAQRSTQELADWALRLGADVPFFVYGEPARIRGIGERVMPLSGLGGIALVIARPPRGLSTAAIYRQFDQAEPRASLTNRGSATSIVNFAAGRTSLRELLVNDLEVAAIEVYPELVSLKTLLQEVGADGVLMTGSGSAVFGIWPSRSVAEVAAQKVRDRGYWAVAAQTLERSPATA